MKTLTKDEFMEAWSIDRAKIVFKDGDIIEGCAVFISNVDSFNDIDEIEIYTKDRECILEPLSEVKEIVDLEK
ncbi:hypothetical protein [uncultured Holdemanella sp.]|mgnify:FL=1|uniref:hypothetical protein n=1 Tax=uncultured Holdemanella sp. TaxID=1763549 RepID=UPI0025F1DB27|nr:hypothetical protein [uncultured Holdemanella sp.]